MFCRSILKGKYTINDTREKLADNGYEDTMLIDGFDKAFIGVSTDGAAVYDYDQVIAVLVRKEKMTLDEAAEYADYNIIRACPYYDPAPVIMTKSDNMI